ncbi:MAG: LacI family DNA-binding transcriptional regulator [Victivallaceae bacterium]|nr:LacI family DNA-binding transcriptional regulator [Victivallaceae bacterium]
MKKVPSKTSDIAEHLGISRATVSYVLNDKWRERGISEATAGKILDYVRKTGFLPNPASLALKGKQVKEIAVLVPPDALEHQKRAFFSLLNLLEQKRKSYMILPLTEDQLAETAHFIRMYRIRNIIAVIMPVNWDFTTKWHRLFGNFAEVNCLFYDFPFERMAINELLISPGSAAAGIDRNKAIFSALEYMLSQGYRNIVLPLWLYNKFLTPDFVATCGAGVKFLNYRNSSAPDLLFENGNFIAEQLPEIRKKINGPLAVYIHDDLTSAAAMTRLIRDGFSIPDDFAILSWDGLPESNYFIKPLSTCVIPHEKMLDIAIKWIDGFPFRSRKIILDVEIRRGETLPKVNCKAGAAKI